MRAAIPFVLQKKKIGTIIFKIATSEIGEVGSGPKNFKTLSKEVRRKTNRKELGGGKKIPKRKTSTFFLKKMGRKTVALAETTLTKKLYYSSHLWRGVFTSCSLEIFDKISNMETITSFYRQEVFPSIPLDEKH